MRIKIYKRKGKLIAIEKSFQRGPICFFQETNRSFLVVLASYQSDSGSLKFYKDRCYRDRRSSRSVQSARPLIKALTAHTDTRKSTPLNAYSRLIREGGHFKFQFLKMGGGCRLVNQVCSCRTGHNVSGYNSPHAKPLSHPTILVFLHLILT
jgi:hypothetical protein